MDGWMEGEMMMDEGMMAEDDPPPGPLAGPAQRDPVGLLVGRHALHLLLLQPAALGPLPLHDSLGLPLHGSLGLPLHGGGPGARGAGPSAAAWRAAGAGGRAGRGRSGGRGCSCLGGQTFRRRPSCTTPASA